MSWAGMSGTFGAWVACGQCKGEWGEWWCCRAWGDWGCCRTEDGCGYCRAWAEVEDAQVKLRFCKDGIKRSKSQPDGPLLGTVNLAVALCTGNRVPRC